jgi:kumamolisin
MQTPRNLWVVPLLVLVLSQPCRAEAATRTLPGHTLPGALTLGARPVQPESLVIPLAVRLQARNAPELARLLERLYDPTHPSYGKFLSPEEFASRFGATPEGSAAVARFFLQAGCKAGPKTQALLLLDFICPQIALEKALQVRISHWLNPAQEPIRTIDRDPTIPADLPIQAILGLTSVFRHSHLQRLSADHPPLSGNGPGGGLSPADILKAYDLGSVALDGSGQVLALFELDGYKTSDIAAYNTQFHLRSVPLQNVLVDGFNGSAGNGADEVTLDIELMNAVSPGAAKLLVYEGPNSDAGVIDTYQKIASDNLARQVSSSWGLAETFGTQAFAQAESAIFSQMAAQGQSIYAASGDAGAYDDGQSLSVDDPASQPYVTATGGTTLKTAADQSYLGETTWWDGKAGGGGGISTFWPIPSWQAGVVPPGSLGSATARNVPDVSLEADPHTGYAIRSGGKWIVVGGTSCAAPLWAAFTALLNQHRLSVGLSPLGFPNPALYDVAKGTAFPGAFQDVADQSTNGYYPAVAGYDLATGWGSFDGARLLVALSGGAPLPSPTPTPSPSPTPPPSGCRNAPAPMTRADTAGALFSMGLPFMVGFAAIRCRRRRD